MFDKNIYPITTPYSIFKNNEEYKNLIKDCFYTNNLEISGDGIIESYKLQKFKKENNLYLNGESNLENVLEYINIDKNVEKLIFQNKDVFKNYLYKIKDVDSYKKLLECFSKDELKYNLGLNNKLDKIIKENAITQKIKNIFKTKK